MARKEVDAVVDGKQARTKLRMRLEIHPDLIDDCLVEHPGYFHDVADAYAEAVAQRDAAKLELKEVSAEMDLQLRKKYADDQQKVTEAQLDKHLTTLPRLQNLSRDLLELSAEVEKWSALKESFQQRSFMLREVVAKYIAELNHLGLERSSGGTKADLADARERFYNEGRRAARAQPRQLSRGTRGART